MKIEKLILEPLDNNCYIITNEKEGIIIDPSGEKEKIEKYLTDNNINLKAIFITHYHFDHIGALTYLKEKYNTKIYDNKTIGKYKEIGLEFNVIPTKGHSKDSVSFHFPKTNDLFVGDFVFEGSIGRMDLPGGDEEEMNYSIKLLKTFKEETKLYPGHGNTTTLKKELRSNPYL